MGSETIKTYTPKERNIYLISMWGQNVVYNVIAACLAYYLQFTILIPAMTVSLIMTFARVWDAFNDPMMGTIVDRTRTKIGKCRPYLIAIPLPIFIITVLCFTSFGFYGQGTPAQDKQIVAWAAITYILFGMIYTIGDIPLWSITALMTESDKDRNKLLSVARIAGGIGAGIVLLAMQPLALGLGENLADTVGSSALGEKYGFLIAAAIFTFIGCGTFKLCGFFVKERIPASKKKYTLKDNFTIAIKNRPFRQIVLSGILGSTKTLLAIAAMPLVTYYFASKNPMQAMLFMALLGGGMFIGMFVGMAITPKLLTKFSKKKVYNYSNLVGVIPYLLLFVMYLIAPQNLTSWYALIPCFFLFAICGASTGITTVMQSLMIADSIDYEEYKNGTRPDGVFFSGQSFVTKLCAGIATIISGLAYSIVHFSDARVSELNAFIAAGGVPRTEVQYSKFMMILFFIVSIPPAIGCILTVIPTWNYCLDDDEHKRILEILNQRRHQKNENDKENIV